MTCEHLVRFVLDDAIDISCSYLNVPCTLGTKFLIEKSVDHRKMMREDKEEEEVLEDVCWS